MLAALRDALEWLLDAVGWLLDGAADFVRELDAAQAALVVFGSVLVLRALVALWRMFRGRPGPVDIAELGEGDEKTGAAQLTELIRARLYDAGIFPAPVPLAKNESPVAIVKEAPLPQAKWVGQLLEHAPGLMRPKHGHRVSGTAWRSDNRISLAVQVADAGSGNAERVVTFDGGDNEDVARQAAAAIYQEITSHRWVRRHTKPWERWRGPTAPGLALLQKAKALEADSDGQKARIAYDKAVEADPLNATVRIQRAAALLETAVARRGTRAPPRFDQLLDAVEDYREIGALWPQFWVARYRLAAIYSFMSWWQKSWNAVPAPQQLKAKQRFGRVTGERFGPNAAGPPIRALLARATRLWAYLLDRGSGRPAQLYPVIEIARLCTRLQDSLIDGGQGIGVARAVVSKAVGLDRRYAWWKRNALVWKVPWELHYNFACLYSLAMANAFSVSERRNHATRAIRHLDATAEARSEELDRTWMRVDPDLENLDRWFENSANLTEDLPASAWFWRGFFRRSI
jgi:hypothetical protein